METFTDDDRKAVTDGFEARVAGPMVIEEEADAEMVNIFLDLRPAEREQSLRFLALFVLDPHIQGFHRKIAGKTGKKQ